MGTLEGLVTLGTIAAFFYWLAHRNDPTVCSCQSQAAAPSSPGAPDPQPLAEALDVDVPAAGTTYELLVLGKDLPC